jgi:hypothetical protein
LGGLAVHQPSTSGALLVHQRSTLGALLVQQRRTLEGLPASTSVQDWRSSVHSCSIGHPCCLCLTRVLEQQQAARGGEITGELYQTTATRRHPMYPLCDTDPLTTLRSTCLAVLLPSPTSQATHMRCKYEDSIRTAVLCFSPGRPHWVIPLHTPPSDLGHAEGRTAANHSLRPRCGQFHLGCQK